jgi:hypothetical protein
MAKGHPVGVILQVSRKPRLYKILGLGIVTTHAHGIFVVEGPQNIEAPLTPLAEAPEDTPPETEDMRQRIMAEVVRRQGQSKFRQSLMAAYGGRCAMSGCSVAQVLEAAHILPYKGKHSNSVRNGILLRADFHTLFDLDLARICPETWTVQILPEAMSQYGGFDGRKAELPLNTGDWPDPERLRQRLELLQAIPPQSM